MATTGSFALLVQYRTGDFWKVESRTGSVVNSVSFGPEGKIYLGTGWYPLNPSDDSAASLEMWSLENGKFEFQEAMSLPGTCVDRIWYSAVDNAVICYVGTHYQASGFLISLDALTSAPRAFHELPGVFAKDLVSPSGCRDGVAVLRASDISVLNWDDATSGDRCLPHWKPRWSRRFDEQLAAICVDPAKNLLFVGNGLVLDYRDGKEVGRFHDSNDFTGLILTKQGALLALNADGDIFRFSEEQISPFARR